MHHTDHLASTYLQLQCAPIVFFFILLPFFLYLMLIIFVHFFPSLALFDQFVLSCLITELCMCYVKGRTIGLDE